jgi:hypothetical protein
MQLEKLKVGQAVSVILGGQSYAGKIKSLCLKPSKRDDDASYQVDVAFTSKEQLCSGLAAVVKLL